ncbi:MAG: hypothetical protein WAK55_02530 [Xanthobacteraceae bacterium]|jgi:hypothetical protein
MADHQRLALLTKLDISDPDFPRKWDLWASEIAIEMDELVAKTKKTLAQSRTVMAEADRLRAQNRSPR